MRIIPHRYLLILVLFLAPIPLYSQFTYIDVSIGNRFMKIAKEKHTYYSTIYNQTNIHVNGLWRFNTYFGVGITASIPIRQGGTYWIIDENEQVLSTSDLQNAVLHLDYYFKESMKVSVNGRIYSGTKENFYLDGRISFLNFNEYLTSFYYTTNYIEENKFRQIAPGFSIGVQPHLTKNLSMNLNIGLDFYKFKEVGFGSTGSDAFLIHFDAYKTTYIKSQLPDKSIAFSANIGVGYFF